MNVLRAFLAGMFFGIWPIVMNRSGLNGNVSAAIFSAIGLMGVLPFALYSNGLSIPAANWIAVLIAGLLGALGILSLNGMLASASTQDVSTLLVVMILTQVGVVALYKVIIDGHLSLGRIVGYLLAAMSAYLLLR